jgi:hypothetical protein
MRIERLSLNIILAEKSVILKSQDFSYLLPANAEVLLYGNFRKPDSWILRRTCQYFCFVWPSGQRPVADGPCRLSRTATAAM